MKSKHSTLYTIVRSYVVILLLPMLFGIDGIWLNWTEMPRPDDDRVYIEVQTFEQAADRIRAML